jgi:hypothetical protein
MIQELIKQYAKRIKLYFDENHFIFFINLKFFNEKLNKHLGFGQFYETQWSFKGFEVTCLKFTIVKKKIIFAYLQSHHIKDFVRNLDLQENPLEGVKYRPDKQTYFEESIQEYVDQSNEDYHEDNWMYDSQTNSRNLFDMSLPTLSEYIKSEEFLLNYAERFLQETLLIE